jgi:hypothetical protein
MPSGGGQDLIERLLLWLDRGRSKGGMGAAARGQDLPEVVPREAREEKGSQCDEYESQPYPLRGGGRGRRQEERQAEHARCDQAQREALLVGPQRLRPGDCEEEDRHHQGSNQDSDLVGLPPAPDVSEAECDDGAEQDGRAVAVKSSHRRTRFAGDVAIARQTGEEVAVEVRKRAPLSRVGQPAHHRRD